MTSTSDHVETFTSSEIVERIDITDEESALLPPDHQQSLKEECVACLCANRGESRKQSKKRAAETPVQDAFLDLLPFPHTNDVSVIREEKMEHWMDLDDTICAEPDLEHVPQGTTVEQLYDALVSQCPEAALNECVMMAGMMMEYSPSLAAQYHVNCLKKEHKRLLAVQHIATDEEVLEFCDSIAEAVNKKNL